MRGDRATRTRYYRARGSHQAAIDRAWAESGGTCTYLGEWHTHPERAPSPSPEDLADWRRKLTVDRYSGFLFFVIAGTEETFAWEGRHGAEVVALALR
jgi:integrative and conjugative element protein (TIGR02256 family)